MVGQFLSSLRSRGPRVSVVRLQGVISAAGGRGNLAHHSLAPVLERAFRKGKPKAVALAINSPGGSPVQSALIGSHIRRLAEEVEVPVHAFIEDVAASGGYWLAAAADDVWLDPSSVTGSIGVISAGFGFHELIARYGIERRVHTAGEDKSLLDPFRPERPEDIVRLKSIQAQIHTTFIDHVKARRGARLAEGRDLFTGDVFVGQDAVDAGLVDGIGHLGPKMREIYGDKTRFQHFSQKRPFLARFGPGLRGGNLMEDALQDIEGRALWARFGL